MAFGSGGGGGTSPLGQQAKQAANAKAFPGETKEQWNRSFNIAYRGLGAKKPAIPKQTTKPGVAKPSTAGSPQDRSAYATSQANAQTYPGQSKVDWNANFQRGFKAYQPASQFAGAGVPTNSPLLDPSKQLSGQSLMDAATALADSQTQGTMTELARQIANNNQKTQAISDKTSGYFNQLGTAANQATQQQQGIASGLNTTLGNIGSNTQSQLQGIQGSALGTLNQYAPGTAGVAAPALATELGRQQGLAGQQAGNQQAFGATLGANAASLSSQMAGTGALRGQERLGNIARAGNLANEPIQSKLAAAIATRGADIKTALGKLRQQEVTNSLARQGLGIKEQQAQTDASKAATTKSNNFVNQRLKASELNIISQNNQANQTLKAKGLSIQQQNDLANQALRQMSINAKAGGPSASRGGGARPLTNNEQLATWSAIGRIASLIQQGQAKHLPGSQIRSTLRSKGISSTRGYDDRLITAAWELLGYGGTLTPGTWNTLRSMGLSSLGSFNGKPIAVQRSTGVGQAVSKGSGNVGSNAFGNTFSGGGGGFGF